MNSYQFLQGPQIAIPGPLCGGATWARNIISGELPVVDNPELNAPNYNRPSINHNRPHVGGDRNGLTGSYTGHMTGL